MKVLLLGNGFDLNHKFPTSYINFLNTVIFLKEIDREKISTIGHVFGSEELHKNDPFIAKCYDEHSRIAEVEGIDIEYPQKRGDYILLPKFTDYGFRRYYDNYVKKDWGEPCEEEFKEFTVDDFEYIIEILLRIRNTMGDTPIAIGLRIPRMMEDYTSSVKLRELMVDYVCNKINQVFYYDLLSGGEVVNGDILPPRVGLKNGIRLIHEFVEDEEELYIRPIPGRVYGEYQIPEQEYRCVVTYKDDVYNMLYASKNCIREIYKNTLINLCEAEYIYDWTQRISFLFDIFDS